MDSVNAFNLELFSMIDMNPPISRAKMMSVTKSAIKAIKLYKHVVQIVEKFIKKCKPELKVPGLYVVDSIVRQSRHQFGVDKDVYGPRFQKNFTPTFQNLYLCPHDDKSKIIRVLNLWQKNAVFEMDIVQPLLDMAAGSLVHAPSPQEDLQAQPQVPSSSIAAVHTPVSSSSIAEALPQVSSASIAAALPQLPPQLQNPEALAAVAQLFQSGQGHELQKILQRFQPGQQTPPMVHNTVADQNHSQMVQGQHNTHHPLLNTHQTHPTEQKNSLAKKLLDRFDYDDEPEEVKREEMNPLVPGNQYDGHFPGQMQPNVEQPFQGQPGRQQTPGGGYPGLNKGYSQSQHTDQGNSREREDPSGRREGRQRGHGRRSRSRSGSRSPRRKRSRSGSPSRKPRHSSQRSGSRSRESRWNSPRSRSQERKEREKDKDRRQKGLPSIKSQTLSVCTTTLWVGQLDKKTSQQDVMCLLEEFGQIDSINMIPPRGCAYIVMVHRQDAYRALHKLGRGSFKVNQKAIKIAWALNKGIKAELKQYWDVELGVTFIPWSKIRQDQIEDIREGGTLDPDTLDPEWRSVQNNQETPEEFRQNGRSEPLATVEDTAGTAPVATPVHPVQVQSMGGVGSLQQHPSFPPGPPGGPPMGLPPPSFPPGVPPGPPPSFMRPGPRFNPMQMMPPGFLPPGSMPLGPSGPPPSAAGGVGVVELSLDPAGLGNQVPGPPGGSPGGPIPLSGGLLGARPGMIPLQRPPVHSPGPVLPPPHMQRFPPPHGGPHGPHPPRGPPHHNMPPQMMPPNRGPHPHMMHHDGPPPPPGGPRGFGMGMPPSHPMRGPFPPHGPLPGGPPPPFMRGGPRGPDGPEEIEGRGPFRGERPGFRDRDPDRERERDWERERETMRERD
eukprot:XP_014019102.1 PREDICTED: splicing factor, arginine/serine-rich 15-like [Salmo salar]